MNNLDDHVGRNDELARNITEVNNFILKVSNIISKSYTTNKQELDKICEDELVYGKSRYTITNAGVIMRLDPNADIVEYTKKSEVSFEDRMKELSKLIEKNKRKNGKNQRLK